MALLTRRSTMVLAPAGVVAVGIGAAALIGLRPPPAAAAIGGPFNLTNGDGQAVTDRDFRGKWLLVYFGYTHCPDACPTALQDMANALDSLGPKKKKEFGILFITVDPDRDTPAVMKDYVSSFEAPITALSGTPQQIAKVAKEYRVYYAKHKTDDGYEMDHSSIIYVIDPQGRFVTVFSGEDKPEAIATKLNALA